MIPPFSLFFSLSLGHFASCPSIIFPPHRFHSLYFFLPFPCVSFMFPSSLCSSSRIPIFPSHPPIVFPPCLHPIYRPPPTLHTPIIFHPSYSSCFPSVPIVFPASVFSFRGIVYSPSLPLAYLRHHAVNPCMTFLYPCMHPSASFPPRCVSSCRPFYWLRNTLVGKKSWQVNQGYGVGCLSASRVFYPPTLEGDGNYWESVAGVTVGGIWRVWNALSQARCLPAPVKLSWCFACYYRGITRTCGEPRHAGRGDVVQVVMISIMRYYIYFSASEIERVNVFWWMVIAN